MRTAHTQGETGGGWRGRGSAACTTYQERALDQQPHRRLALDDEDGGERAHAGGAGGLVVLEEEPGGDAHGDGLPQLGVAAAELVVDGLGVGAPLVLLNLEVLGGDLVGLRGLFAEQDLVVVLAAHRDREVLDAVHDANPQLGEVGLVDAPGGLWCQGERAGRGGEVGLGKSAAQTHFMIISVFSLAPCGIPRRILFCLA